MIAFPGRNGSQRPARMLARHGYGVLLFDRRGEGRSEGEPNSWGWGGDADVKAAIDYLQRRPDVDPERIGGIGLSVGGEMMIETAAETDELAAVVSEGAGARTFSEDMDREDEGPVAKYTLGAAMSAVKTAAVAISANQAPPANLKDLAARTFSEDMDQKGDGALTKYTLGAAMSAVKTAAVAISANHAPPANLKDLAARVDQPLLLIAAPNSPNGERLNRGYHAAAGANSTLWEIPESRHVGGLAARPEEYERRVVGFFDDALT